MDDQTRFAKMFKLTSENGKMWILIYVENKIGVGMQCRDLKTYIKAERIESKDQTGTLSIALSKMRKSSDLDIIALNIIVEKGNILNFKEKEVCGVPNVVGHLIARLRHLRNDIAHTGEARLEVEDYNCYLDKLRDIAKHFEIVNGVAQYTYKQEIDHIDRQKWADKEVQDTLQLYHTYLENIMQSAIFQQGLLSCTNLYSRHGEDVMKMENEILKKEINKLQVRLNLTWQLKLVMEVKTLSPIRGVNTAPHPECDYCRQAHAAENQANCNVM